MKRLTTEEFIAKAREIHGDKYNYDNTVYTSAKDKVCIVCHTHGVFEQQAANHLQGKGCIKCKNAISGATQRSTTATFILRAREVHKQYYNYDKVIYKNAKIGVDIICPVHGVFTQAPETHLLGRGCPSCGYIRSAESGRDTTKTFIHKARKIHKAIYSYKETVYTKSSVPVIITCSIHGNFKQRPRSHLSGSGCPKCKVISIQEALRKDNSYFIQRAIYKHGSTYGYEEVQYVGCYIPVRIRCQKHGFFMQTPSKHIHGAGCPVCNSSKGELMIKNFLVNKHVAYIQEKTFSACKSINKLPFDFAIFSDTEKTQLLCLIEYDGEQHYKSVHEWGGEEALLGVQKRDAIKTQYCLDNSIKLIRIPYWEKDNIEAILTKELI